MPAFPCPHCGQPIEAIKSRSHYNHDQALALLRFGATTTEVAELMGVHRQTIYNLKRNREVTHP